MEQKEDNKDIIDFEKDKNIESENLIKKKNKRALIVIFVSLGLLALIAFCVPSNKTLETKKDNESSPSSSTEENTSDNNTSEVQNTENDVQTSCNILDSVPYEEKSIKENYAKIPVNQKIAKLYYYLMDYTSNKNRSNGIKSFTNSEILELAFTYADYDINNLNCLKSREVDGVKKEYDVLLKDNAYANALKEIFGSATKVDYNLPVGNKIITKTALPLPKIKILASSITVNSYDAKTKKYSITAENYSPGAAGGPGAQEKFINQVEDSGVITFTKKVVYYDNSSNKSKTVAVYSDESLKNQIGTAQITNIDDYNIDIEPFLDKAKTINYTFKLDKTANKYYFVSSIIE